MSSLQTVLVVMKASPRRDRITQALASLGAKVLIDETLKEGQESLRRKRPDLVLASLELADAQDAEVVLRLRADARGSMLPLLVDAPKLDPRTKVELWKAGADDLMEGDVPAEEIAARIGAMLKRFRRLGAVLPDAESIDRRKITFLQSWAAKAGEPLKPAASTESRFGYTYEKARAHFGCAAGAEIEFLEDLATRMCLDRKFYDRVHLCPECAHHAINFREVSPRTKSPDISRVEMLHHIQCGHVALVKDFINGLDYVCPKCNTQLQHVGDDYERLARMYVDNATGESFPKPEIDCVCLACGFVSDPDRLSQRNIYVYALAERGLLAAETGYLYDVSLDAVLMDYDLQIYNPTYFQRQLGIELERARRYSRPLGLALLRIDQYDIFLEQYGEQSRQYLTQVAETLKNNTRSSDIIARHDQNSIVLLFPETDLEGARNACEKLRNAVLKLKSPRPDSQLTVSCGVSSYPEIAEDQQGLVRSAGECFAKAHDMGGNIVVVAGTTGAKKLR